MRWKRLGVISAASIALITSAMLLAQALKADYEMELSVDRKNYKVNGETKRFDLQGEPVNDPETGEMLVPLRLVMEELGGSVQYQPESQGTEVAYKNITLTLFSDSRRGKVNEYDIVFPEKPEMIGETLYVTPEFISENFGVSLEWVDEKKQIVLRVGETKPPSININRIEFEKDGAKYSLETPVITGVNDKQYEKQLNGEFMQDTMDELRKMIFAVEKATPEQLAGKRLLWEKNCLVTLRKSQMISFVEQNYRADLTGVSNQKKAVTIDLQSQKKLQLQDLFRSSQYQGTIEAEINSMIQGNPNSYGVEGPVTIEDGQLFYLTKEELVILKQQKPDTLYMEFKIPYVRLAQELKQEYAFLAENS